MHIYTSSNSYFIGFALSEWQMITFVNETMYKFATWIFVYHGFLDLLKYNYRCNHRERSSANSFITAMKKNGCDSETSPSMKIKQRFSNSQWAGKHSDTYDLLIRTSINLLNRRQTCSHTLMVLDPSLSISNLGYMGTLHNHLNTPVTYTLTCGTCEDVKYLLWLVQCWSSSYPHWSGHDQTDGRTPQHMPNPPKIDKMFKTISLLILNTCATHSITE